MQRILFTCGIMTIGGVQKSLLSILNQLDFTHVDVSLMLPIAKGDLLGHIPSYIKIVEAPKIIISPSFSRRELISDLRYLINNKNHLLPFFRSCFFAINDNSRIAREKYWEMVKDKEEYRYSEYDTAVSFAGGIGLWNQFVIDKIKARYKVCWLHGDCQRFINSSSNEKNYLLKFDNIVTVSNEAEETLLKVIPQLRGRTQTIKNYLDRDSIIDLADTNGSVKNEFAGIKFVSVARLDRIKGLDVAIKAFARAVSDGLHIRWDIIGEGGEKRNLQLLIDKLNMKDHITLLGKMTNPYPYLKNADVFIHPSRSEGFSMSILEAKLLAKPILVTKFPTVNDQIEDGITGRIVLFTEGELYNGIFEMASDKNLRDGLTGNLDGFKQMSVIDNINQVLRI